MPRVVPYFGTATGGGFCLVKAKVRFENRFFSGCLVTLLNRAVVWTHEIIHVKALLDSV